MADSGVSGPSAARALGVLLDAGKPTGRAVVQSAVAGRWENARSLDVPADGPAARALVRDAGPADADVAVEYEWLGPPLVFVGARRTGAGGEFEDDVARLAAGALTSPEAALTALAGGPPTEVDHVELGAANAWHSVGPLRLWTRDAQRSPAPLAERLREHTALARCAMPVALEVAFRHPRPCWLGVQVSTATPEGHAVEAATVEALLAQLLGAER